MKEKTKREYQKPEFTRVKLVPEEAVLGGCKDDNTVDVGNVATGFCYTPTTCQLQGS